MMDPLKRPVSLPLEDLTLPELIQSSTDFALMNGLGMRSKTDFSLGSLTFTPFLLLPTSFPRGEFEKAVRIQNAINQLVHNIAYNDEFLRKTLASTIKVDDFTARLFQIYDTVQKEGFAQKFSLGLLRSDYMLDNADLKIKQVEINTISCSFGALTTVFPALHRHVLSALGQFDQVQNIPDTRSLEGYAMGMLEAWKIYNSKTACVLFVVEDITYNICDQRMLEFEILKQNPRVRVLRKTLTEIGKQSTLESGNRLFVDGFEIAVIYFRAAYAPKYYPTELEWDARLLMERSMAIKCPSIQYQLAGTKKVQQELTIPGVLEQFLSSKDQVDAVREVFTGLYSIDMNDPKAEEAIEMGIRNPEKYVLKPQREGGGNNIYDEEVKTYLEKIRTSSERDAWILMEKINPPLQKNYMLRPELKEPIYTDMVSELGIYGVVIGDADNITTNETVGHMLRTKVSSANEAGVSAGNGALDGLFLV